MSAVVKLDGSTVGATRWLARGFGEPGPELANAADGTGSFGGIVFDDPAGNMTVTGWQTATVDETDCTAAPRLQTGYVYDRVYSRGKHSAAAGREIDCTILDQNAVLSLRIITGADGKRPAETDTARIAWLLGSSYLSALIADLGLVNGAGRAFETSDYRGQYPADVLNDLCGPRGQIFFAYWDQTAAAVGLFYDDPTAVTFTSSLSISNVASDVDSATCFAPYIDASLKVDPSGVYSRVRYTKKGGSAVFDNLTTAAAFFPHPLVTRGVQITNERVGLRSTAETFANRYLLAHSTEAKTVTCTVRLPSTKVGLIDAGHRISVRFSHLPGFETAVWTRVESRTIQQVERKPSLYEVTLTLSTKGLTTGIGGGDPGNFPHESSGSPPSQVQHNYGNDIVTLPLTPTPGNMLVIMANDRVGNGAVAAPTGWTKIAGADQLTGTNPSHGSEAYYRVCVAGDTAVSPLLSGLVFDFSEWTPCTIGTYVTVQDGVASHITAGGTITPDSANAIILGVFGVGAFDSLTWAMTTDAGVTEMVKDLAFPGGNTPWTWVGYRTVTSTSPTTVGASVTNSASDAARNLFSGITIQLLGTPDTDPPAPGTEVPWEVVTMTTVGGVSTGTTAFPYANLSLKVKVDGVLISPASFVETDGSLGTFALTWIVDSDEVVTVSYQAL